MTALHVAAERAHNDILEVLQKHGAKVSFRPLFCRAGRKSGSRVLTRAPLAPQVNAVDTLGQTALHRAALAGHIQTCKLLLSYGADPSVVSLQGFTAAQMGNEAVQQILNGKHGRHASVYRCWLSGLRMKINSHLSFFLIQKMFLHVILMWTTDFWRQPKQEIWTLCK